MVYWNYTVYGRAKPWPCSPSDNLSPTESEPGILECEVKWALGSITTNKASGGAGIPVKLFQILKDALPLRGSPHTPGAPPWHRASPSLCSDPILSLEAWRLGTVSPTPLGDARVPLAPPLRSGTRLRRHRRPCCPQDASSGLPSGMSRLAPRSLPPCWDSSPSALLPLGPCSSNCSWLPSRSPCQNWASVYWGSNALPSGHQSSML